MDLWGTIRKFGPVAIIVGYVVLYMTKKTNGVYQILPDIQNITAEKLIGKWQNFAIAGAAYIAMQFLHKVKMPAAMRVLVQVGLYFLIGYEIALAIDPPGGAVAYQPPVHRNPYQIGG